MPLATDCFSGVFSCRPKLNEAALLFILYRQIKVNAFPINILNLHQREVSESLATLNTVEAPLLIYSHFHFILLRTSNCVPPLLTVALILLVGGRRKTSALNIGRVCVPALLKDCIGPVDQEKKSDA